MREGGSLLSKMPPRTRDSSAQSGKFHFSCCDIYISGSWCRGDIQVFRMSFSPEDIEHIKTVDWFRYEYPELKEDFHHFANQRKCTPMEGRKLKRMGVMRGVSDFFLAVPRHGHHGLWVELKAGAGRLSPEQKEFIKRKNANGYLAIPAWGYDEAKNIIKEYLQNASA